MVTDVGVNPAAAVAKGNQVADEGRGYAQVSTHAQNACRGGQAAAGERAVIAGFGALGEALVTAVTKLGGQAQGLGGQIAAAGGMAAATDHANAGGYGTAANSLPPPRR